MKKRLIYIALLVIPLLFVYWLYTHSFIEINLAEASGGEAVYRLYDQSSDRTAEIKTNKSKVRRMVRRGSHEILVENNGQSFFSIVKAGGWLGTSRVSADPKPENSRQFIGDNPGECMNLIAGMLVSSACIDNFTNIEAHLPATESLPTRVRKIQSGIDGIVEGIVVTPRGTYILAQATDQTGHFVYPINKRLEIGSATALSDLNATRAYQALSYREGFVVFDELGQEALYYASVDAQPKRIDLGGADNPDFRAYDFDAREDKLAILLGEVGPDGEEANSEEFEREARRTQDSKFEVTIYRDGSARHFSLEGVRPTDIRFCGSGLCLLRETALEVFEVSDEELVLKYRVAKVNAVDVAGENIILVRENEVLDLNVATGEGFVGYQTDGYGTCGVKVESGNYLVCVVNADAKRSALLVNRTEPNDDDIDKKIAELSKLSEVKDLSVYQNYIFISPELGNLGYIASEGGYGYDPRMIDRVSEIINRKIDELKIDRAKYKIINTFE